MDIVAIGTDLVDMRRIGDLVRRFGQRFIDRCYGPDEQALAQPMRDPLPFYARRYAAKEAVAKALGTGIGLSARLREIQVLRGHAGAPHVVLSGAALATLRDLTASDTSRVMVSLSDEPPYALAFAVITRMPGIRPDQRTDPTHD